MITIITHCFTYVGIGPGHANDAIKKVKCHSAIVRDDYDNDDDDIIHIIILCCYFILQPKYLIDPSTCSLLCSK